jgi:sRNA-binding carbon storage regulator CsrA
MKLPDGREIRVKVSQIRGRRVSIGIEAPPDIKIIRGEAEEPK